MGCDVDGSDLLSGLSSACGGGVEGRFDGVAMGGQHSMRRRVCYRDDEVGVLGSVVFLGVGEDVGAVGGYFRVRKLGREATTGRPMVRNRMTWPTKKARGQCPPT